MDFSDWKTKKIDDIGKIITGTTPPTKIREYYGNKYPFITPTDMTFDKKIIITKKSLSGMGYKKFKNKFLPKNSVCYTCIASIGKICMTNEPSITNQQINSIIVNEKKYNPHFIFYLLRNETDKIKLYAGGVAAPIINKSIFSNIEIKIPSKDIQDKIAYVLSCFDDLIEINLMRIRILEEVVQSLYNEWFLNLKFPGYENTEIIETENGPTPKGWKHEPLGILSKITMGQSPKSIYYNDIGEGLPFHQGVSNFGKIYPTTVKWSTEGNRYAKHGDILFSVRAPVGRMNIANKTLILGRGLCGIRSYHNQQYFLYHQLKRIFHKEDIMGSGTIFKAVTKSDMTNLKILVPEQKIIDQYERIVNEIYSLIENLSKKNGVLKECRNLLLPKLISGEIDVSDLDIDIGG